MKKRCFNMNESIEFSKKLNSGHVSINWVQVTLIRLLRQG